MLYGAIIGDIVGSRFEMGQETKSKKFEFFHYTDQFTDDTITTIAIAEATKRIKRSNCSDEESKQLYIDYLKKWCKLYPGVGYGSSFYEWVFSENSKPYNSWGNGSAMRVSAIGNSFNSLEETEKQAKLSAEITHNHVEGIRGAQTIAGCIYLARTTHSRLKIVTYVKSKGYKLQPLFFSRPKHQFDVSCIKTVPIAIEAFLESHNFEDAIRNAVSMGGDSDTIAAMTGSIAEAYYKNIPEEMKEKCRSYLDNRLLLYIR